MKITNHKIPITKQGYDKLLNKLSDLENKRPAIVTRLSEAREKGDLSENASYHTAREELAFFDGEIQELKEVIAKSQIITTRNTKKTVSLGCRVTVLHTKGTKYTYHIVGEWEADPMNKKISHQSPLGKALIGKKVGEQVISNAPAGQITYTIKKIE